MRRGGEIDDEVVVVGGGRRGDRVDGMYEM
jgi:hypothetical protein